MSVQVRHYLIPAASVGVLADGLIRGAAWGVNIPLCVLALAIGASFVPPSHCPERREATGLLWAAVVAALGLAWRTAEPLVLANLLATMGLLMLTLIRASGLRLDSVGLIHLTRAMMRSALTVAAGAIPCLAQWKPNPVPSAGKRKWRAILTGVGIAIPVSAVFTVLLANADPLFESAVRAMFSWDGELVATHVALSGGFAWLACGFLLGLGRPSAPALSDGPDSSAAPSLLDIGDKLGLRPAATTSWSLGLTEIAIPLGGLAGIFAVFVGLQARYFFGGDAVVLGTTGLGWGEYARRGFFELVAVTVLVLPLLLAADGALNRDDAKTMRGFRSLAVILLGLVSLIAASAVYRLWLYYGVYGLSPTRVYAAALMLWIGTVLAWFAATVLRERRGPFAIGAIVSGLVVLAGLNIVNPDGLVARVNLRRAAAGAGIDRVMLSQLSTDAAPALMREMRRLRPIHHCEMAMAVSARWRDARLDDWREWSVGRARGVSAAKNLSALCGNSNL